MTHDPLCPVIPADANFSDWGCLCELIAKVRADEKASHDRCLCHQLNGVIREGGRVKLISIGGITLEDRNEVLDEVQESLLVECGKVIAAIDALRGKS